MYEYKYLIISKFKHEETLAYKLIGSAILPTNMVSKSNEEITKELNNMAELNWRILQVINTATSLEVILERDLTI